MPSFSQDVYVFAQRGGHLKLEDALISWGKYVRNFGIKMHKVQQCQKWCNFAHVEKNRRRSGNLSNEHLLLLCRGCRNPVKIKGFLWLCPNDQFFYVSKKCANGPNGWLIEYKGYPIFLEKKTMILGRNLTRLCGLVQKTCRAARAWWSSRAAFCGFIREKKHGGGKSRATQAHANLPRFDPASNLGPDATMDSDTGH